MNNLPFLDVNNRILRILYTRYADDWIILTNVKIQILKNNKRKG